MKLEEIGFYTLTNVRAESTSSESQMKRCEMIINDYCNFNCSYCNGLAKEVFFDRKRKELTLEEMKANIDYWCENEPLENIRFSGGEPTYHKHLNEVVKYAKEKGIKRVAISTNGSNRPEVYEDLIKSGCDDFSISLDASDSCTGDFMAGNIKGSWNKVVHNIEWISKEVYVTVGVVLNPDNIDSFLKIVDYASNLNVDDIRVIPSSKWNEPLIELSQIDQKILDKHPILRYRVGKFIAGEKIRGISNENHGKCPLVLDDSVIAGQDHYPCVIYMREQGKPIGKVSKNMRKERVFWYKNIDTKKDIICKNNCLDVCVDYNNKVHQHNKKVIK